MSGNVAEWCFTYCDESHGDNRGWVFYWGSFSRKPSDLRIDSKHVFGDSSTDYNCGFRFVRSDM